MVFKTVLHFLQTKPEDFSIALEIIIQNLREVINKEADFFININILFNIRHMIELCGMEPSVVNAFKTGHVLGKIVKCALPLVKERSIQLSLLHDSMAYAFRLLLLLLGPAEGEGDLDSLVEKFKAAQENEELQVTFVDCLFSLLTNSVFFIQNSPNIVEGKRSRRESLTLPPDTTIDSDIEDMSFSSESSLEELSTEQLAALLGSSERSRSASYVSSLESIPPLKIVNFKALECLVKMFPYAEPSVQAAVCCRLTLMSDSYTIMRLRSMNFANTLVQSLRSVERYNTDAFQDMFSFLFKLTSDSVKGSVIRSIIEMYIHLGKIRREEEQAIILSFFRESYEEKTEFVDFSTLTRSWLKFPAVERTSNEPFAVSFWFKLVHSRLSLLCQLNSFALEVRVTDGKLQFTDQNSTFLSSLDTKEWNHLVLTSSTSIKRRLFSSVSCSVDVFLNGDLVGSVQIDPANLRVFDGLLKCTPSSPDFRGAAHVTQIMFLNQSLTQDQAREIQQLGPGASSLPGFSVQYSIDSRYGPCSLSGSMFVEGRGLKHYEALYENVYFNSSKSIHYFNTDVLFALFMHIRPSNVKRVLSLFAVILSQKVHVDQDLLLYFVQCLPMSHEDADSLAIIRKYPLPFYQRFLFDFDYWATLGADEQAYHASYMLKQIESLDPQIHQKILIHYYMNLKSSVFEQNASSSKDMDAILSYLLRSDGLDAIAHVLKNPYTVYQGRFIAVSVLFELLSIDPVEPEQLPLVVELISYNIAYGGEITMMCLKCLAIIEWDTLFPLETELMDRNLTEDIVTALVRYSKDSLLFLELSLYILSYSTNNLLIEVFLKNLCKFSPVNWRISTFVLLYRFIENEETRNMLLDNIKLCQIADVQIQVFLCILAHESDDDQLESIFRKIYDWEPLAKFIPLIVFGIEVAEESDAFFAPLKKHLALSEFAPSEVKPMSIDEMKEFKSSFKVVFGEVKDEVSKKMRIYKSPIIGSQVSVYIFSTVKEKVRFKQKVSRQVQRIKSYFPNELNPAYFKYKIGHRANKHGIRMRLDRVDWLEDHESAAKKRDIDKKRRMTQRKSVALMRTDPTVNMASQLSSMNFDILDVENESEYSFISDHSPTAIEVEIIYFMIQVKGTFEITAEEIIFIMDEDATQAKQSTSERDGFMKLLLDVFYYPYKIRLIDLREVYERYYLYSKCVLELVDRYGRRLLVNLMNEKTYQAVILRIKSIGLKKVQWYIEDTSTILKETGMQQKWLNGQISNFEYLLFLNSISGRSFLDLTRYPVFPWDLTKPIGALNPERLRRYVQRYETFTDSQGNLKQFMYGSHYSSAAACLFYLLRLEPFTTLHIMLQNGRFDHADRQFDSVQEAWNSVLKNSGDVKELIPEFFCFPDFLKNLNNYNLGVKHSGEAVNHIGLPPWAETPNEFIQRHREALESDYVSANIHHWIDLIWGYKQTGPEAVAAHNVFYPTCYFNSVDIESIEDKTERKAIETEILNFGQTPMQLFTAPHPKKIKNPGNLALLGVDVLSLKIQDKVVFGCVMQDRALCFTHTGEVFAFTEKPSPKLDKIYTNSRYKSFAQLITSSYMAAKSVDKVSCTNIIIACLRDRLELWNPELNDYLSIALPTNHAKKCAISEDGKFVAYSDDDDSIYLLRISSQILMSDFKGPIDTHKANVLFNSLIKIDFIAISSEYGFVLSCDSEGCALIHDLDTLVLQSILHMKPTKFIFAHITSNGNCFLLANNEKEKTDLFVFSMNGMAVEHRSVPRVLKAVADDNIIVMLDANSKITVYDGNMYVS